MDAGGCSQRRPVPLVQRRKRPRPTAINTLQSYDPAACAAKCASNSLCRSFGIWIERTPCSSTNQEPAYQTKCIQYSFNIQTGDLNNQGQWAGTGGKFYRTQTGVKAYNMKDFVPPAVTGFNRPTTSDSALRVTSPEDVVKNWGFSYDILQRDPSTAIPDPNICAKQCADINAAGPVDEVKKSCNAFQLVHLTKTDAQSYQRAYGFICRFFTDVPSGTSNPPLVSPSTLATFIRRANRSRQAFCRRTRALPAAALTSASRRASGLTTTTAVQAGAHGKTQTETTSTTVPAHLAPGTSPAQR